MKFSDLESGDLIFTVLKGYGADDPDLPSHVMMYTPDEDSVRDLSHAVRRPDGRENGFYRTSSAMLNKNAKYMVFRCQQRDMAEQAARQAIQWEQFLPPYDETRQAQSHKFDNASADPELQFNLFGKYTAIKMAARRNTTPFRLKQDNLGRGDQCCGMVMRCYHAAALQDYVDPITPETGWVSNKYIDFTVYPKDMFSNSYLQTNKDLNTRPDYFSSDYEHILKIQNPPNYSKVYLQKHPTYRPVILQWKSEVPIEDFDFQSALTPGMALDPKTTSIDCFFQSLQQCEQWQSWELDIKNSELPEKRYNKYQNEMEQRDEQIKLLHTGFFKDYHMQPETSGKQWYLESAGTEINNIIKIFEDYQPAEYFEEIWERKKDDYLFLMEDLTSLSGKNNEIELLYSLKDKLENEDDVDDDFGSVLDNEILVRFNQAISYLEGCVESKSVFDSKNSNKKRHYEEEQGQSRKKLKLTN